MGYGSLSAIALAATTLLGAGLGTGCNGQRQQTGQLLATTEQAYGQLPSRLAALRSGMESLRQDVEELATKVPGGAELRSRYFGADEVLGVLDAKVKWLAGELETAKRDPDKDRVVSLHDAIVQTAGDVRQVSDVAVELRHERARLQRMAALFKAPYERELPTGFLVKAAKDGVEAHLIDFLADGNQPAGQATWLDFDRLELAPGEAALVFPASRSQLENVAQILRAYPGARLQIGVYADQSGAAAAKLAARRAEAVRKALVQAGVSPGRLTAQGNGQHPACLADVADCHARDPRIAALVTAK